MTLCVRNSLALRIAAGLALAFALASGTAAEIVAVDGGTLSYETCGAGERTIVLVHDGVMDASSFDDVWKRLCGDFRVVRYDRRGYGKSPVSTTPYIQTDDLQAVLTAAKVQHASLAGFSVGGGIALDYALDHPAVVDRLILVGAQISGFRTTAHFNRRNTGVFMPILIGNLDWVISNAMKDPWLMAPGHDAARARATAIAKANPQNIKHLLGDKAKPAPSALPRMPSLLTPTLILTGDHDIPDVHAGAGAAQALLPNARREVVSDAGHLMQLEHPDQVADLIADFVRRGR